MKYVLLILLLFSFGCASNTKDSVENTFTSEIIQSKNHRKISFHDFARNSVLLTQSICIDLHEYNFQYGNYNKQKFLEYTEKNNWPLYDALTTYAFNIEDTVLSPYAREKIWISYNDELLNHKTKNLPYFKMNSKNFDKFNFYYGSCDDVNEAFNFPIEFYNGEEKQDIKSYERWKPVYQYVTDEFDTRLLHAKIYQDGRFEVFYQLDLNSAEIENIVEKVKSHFPEYRNYEYAIFKIDNKW